LLQLGEVIISFSISKAIINFEEQQISTERTPNYFDDRR